MTKRPVVRVARPQREKKGSDAKDTARVSLRLSEWQRGLGKLHRMLMEDLVTLADQGNLAMDQIVAGSQTVKAVVPMTSWTADSPMERAQRVYALLEKASRDLNRDAGPKFPGLALYSIALAYSHMRSAEGQIDATVKKRAAELVKQQTKKAAAARHAADHEARRMVENYWLDRRDMYTSLNHAGQAVHKWLLERLRHEANDRMGQEAAETNKQGGENSAKGTRQVTKKQKIKPPTARTVTNWLREFSKTESGRGGYYRSKPPR